MAAMFAHLARYEPAPAAGIVVLRQPLSQFICCDAGPWANMIVTSACATHSHVEGAPGSHRHADMRLRGFQGPSSGGNGAPVADIAGVDGAGVEKPFVTLPCNFPVRHCRCMEPQSPNSGGGGAGRKGVGEVVAGIGWHAGGVKPGRHYVGSLRWGGPRFWSGVQSGGGWAGWRFPRGRAAINEQITSMYVLGVFFGKCACRSDLARPARAPLAALMHTLFLPAILGVALALGRRPWRERGRAGELVGPSSADPFA